MYKVENVTSDPSQSFNLIIPNSTDTMHVTLRYIYNLQSWYMNFEYKAVVFNNRRVCSSLNLLQQWKKILRFGLACYTMDGSDPFFIDDFEKGRCGLLVLSESEVDNYNQLLSSLKNEV